MYGIFTYIYHQKKPNVGVYIYIPYMDPMGTVGMGMGLDSWGMTHGHATDRMPPPRRSLREAVCRKAISIPPQGSRREKPRGQGGKPHSPLECPRNLVRG